jgi:hypothetical protein
VDNGFHQIDGGDRGDPPEPPLSRALLSYRGQRQRPANDNALPLGLAFAAFVILLGLAWAALV